MQVFFISLILYFNQIARAENNESKLIDLLPEKEKEDFLDKIARRILEEVQSNDDNAKGSRELSDDQLNQHNEYVQKILKEESQNLRKKSDETAKQDTEPGVVKVVPSDKKDVRSEDRYVDLTLRSEHRNKRENSRRIFTGYLSDNDKNIDNGSESEVDIQVKNFRRNKESVEITTLEEIETTSQTESTTEEIENSTQSNTQEKEAYVAAQGGLSNDDIKNEENIDVVQKNISSENDTNVSDSVNEFNKSLEILTTTEKILDTYVNITDNFTSDNNQNMSKIQNTIDNKNTSRSGGPRISRSYDEHFEFVTKQKYSNLDEATDKLKDSKVINIEVTSVTETTETPIAKYELLTTVSPTNTKIQSTINHKTGVTAKGTNNDLEIFFSSDKTNAKGNTDKIQNEFMFLDKSIHDEKSNKALRNAEEVAISKQDKHFNDLKAQYEQNKIKAYEVYEISPDDTPFVKQERLMKKPKTTKKPTIDEQPYYVPVYNYKPENAFFDGHNIYGLNSDSEKEKDFYINNKEGIKDEDKSIYTLVYKHSPSNAFYSANNIYGRNYDSSHENNNYAVKRTDEIDYTIERMDDEESDAKKDDERNKQNFQWDYYFSTDPMRKGANYLPGRMGIKDEKKINCGKFACGKFSDEVTTSKPDCDPVTEFDPLFTNHTNAAYLGDSIRHIRELLLEQKVFSFIKSPEDHAAISDELEEIEAKELSYLRAKDTKIKGKTHQDIAVDYYFGRSRMDDESLGDKEGESKENSNKPQDYHVPVEFYNVLQFKDNKNNVNKQKITSGESGKRISRTDKNGKTDYELMKKIIDMVPSGKDLVTTVLKLQEINLKKKTERTKVSKDIDFIVTVLSDMIKENNKALRQYAWLETAVDLQSAIKKMIDLVEGIQTEDKIHPSDLELLKYIIYLHTKAKKEFEDQDFRKSRTLLPKTNKNKKGIIKQSGLLYRAWLIRMLDKKPAIPEHETNDFEEFLSDLQTALFDLHTALKYISMVTTHKTQKWFENLKQIYVDFNRKQLLEIMLHFWTTRLLGLVEETAKNGLEDDFFSYVKKNEKEVDRTKEEFVFVLRLLDEIKRSQ